MTTDAVGGQPADIEAIPYPSPAVGWFATITLAFLYWMSMLDRFIISLLIDPIKADLGLSDVQFGLLQGVAFMISFTLFGFIFGALADRRDRRRLIYIGVTVWSIASAACGLAQNFWHLLVARAGLGAGEASLNPCATSMISDLFPRARLTTAMAVYSMGATVGSGTALMLGGAIIHWVSGLGEIVLPVVGQLAVWQAVFLIVGLPGLLFAFIVFVFPEPMRRGAATAPIQHAGWLTAYGGLFAFMASHRRFYVAHYSGFTLAAALVTGCVGWYPVHMMRAHGWSQGETGFYLGLALLLAGLAGKLVCGWLVDMLYRRGYRDGPLRWYATCLLLAVPPGVYATTSGSPVLFLVVIGIFVTLITGMQACALSSLNMVTPNHLRGSGVAVFTTVVGLLGSAGGSVAIPFIAQTFYSGDSAIGYGMATLMAIACPLAAAALFMGMPAMRRAMLEYDSGGESSRSTQTMRL
ncbi:MAG: MFS transporter [Gammaproteobacteria bacterium]